MSLSSRDKQLLAFLKEEGTLDAIRLRILAAQVKGQTYGSVEEALRGNSHVDEATLKALLHRIDHATQATLEAQLRDEAPVINIEKLAGESIGGYRLERILGKGAMGVVYYATPEPDAEELPDEPRALKLLKPKFGADHRYLIRFMREARTMEGLEHPGLVRAHGHGVWQEIPFLLMEFVKGQSLEELLKQNERLLEIRVIWIALKVLAPLHVMHNAGLVHRDLKPSNIIVDRTYGPRITDFGVIADTTSKVGSGRLTRVGTVIGTGAYLPPELTGLSEKPQEIDGRADLYSLGCVLYTCLAGQPPFEGKSGIQLYAAHLEDAPPPLREATDCSPATEAFIMRLLAKKPAHRPASALVARREAAKIWKRLRSAQAG